MSLAFFLLYRFQGSRPEEQPNFPPGKRLRKRRRVERRGKGESPRTLTTAYEQRRDQERLVISVQYDERKLIGQERLVLGENRRKNQAKKSTGRMPRHHTPKKDAVSCEKLWGAASRH